MREQRAPNAPPALWPRRGLCSRRPAPDVRQGFARMRQPWEQAEYKRVGQLAHQWKGTCSYVGAKQAQRAAARLEQSAKALADAESSEFLCKEATAALHAFRAELLLVAPSVPRALADLEQVD